MQNILDCSHSHQTLLFLYTAFAKSLSEQYIKLLQPGWTTYPISAMSHLRFCRATLTRDSDARQSRRVWLWSRTLRLCRASKSRDKIAGVTWHLDLHDQCFDYYRTQVRRKVLFLALSVTFLFVHEISREPLNRIAPNSQGRCVWSLARMSLKAKVIRQRSRSPWTKNGIFGFFGGLRVVYVW